jgi:Protein of unknown function (DUF4232)
MFPYRPLARLGAGLTLAVILAACGSAAAPKSAPAEPGGHGSVGPAACTAGSLHVSLDASAAGVAAGSSYVPLDFTNAAKASCSLSGYPAVGFASSLAGPLIGTEGSAAKGVQSAPLVLAPGQVAHAWLQILDVANYPADECKLAQASGLRVGFGTTEAATFLAHPFQACASGTRGSDVLAVYPVQAGPAKRGTAP